MSQAPHGQPSESSLDLGMIRLNLVQRRGTLLGRMAHIDNVLHTELPADFEEQAGELAGQDTYGSLEESARQEIRQIDLALKRIDEGSYGICERCGEPINPKRLLALPTALRCVACS